MESAKGGNRRGCGTAPCGESGRGPLESRRLMPGPSGPGASSSRARGPQSSRGVCGGRSPARQGWAGLGCAGTGRRPEGSVRGSEAAAGNRTYVPSACWRRRCAELASQGTPGPSGASHRAARAGQGRAGPGRAGRDCVRRPARPGFTRVWRPALVPPLGPARKPMARRPLPRAGCLAPEGGRRAGGGEGLGPPGSGVPRPRLS